MPNNTAAHANAKIRLAKRAKRARFSKENKTKILLLGALVVFAPVILAFMPATSNWFDDQAKEMIKGYEATGDSDKLAEAIEKRYQLSQLYSYTLRPDKAAKQWDEIAKWYYGYSLMKWAEGAQKAIDAENDALIARKNIQQGKSKGPPYGYNEATRQIDWPQESIPYLEKVVINIAEHFLNTSPAHPQWRFNILSEKYLGKDRYSAPTKEPGLVQRHKNLVDPEKVKWAEEQFTLFKGN